MNAPRDTRDTAWSRRSFFVGGGAAAATALLGACGPFREADRGSTASQAPASLFFLGRGSPTYQQAFEDLSRQFMQQSPRITVQYTHESGNFDQKYQVLAASDQTPDVGFSTVANYKAHVARGLAAYLDDLAKRDRQFKEADYDAYWLVALRYKGRLSGLPWDPGMVVLYYNRGLLQKAGLRLPDPRTPLTWDDTLEQAKRLTVESGGQVAQWGLELWWARFWWQIPRQLGLLDVYQGDEHVLKLDHPLALEALQWLADLRLKLKVSRPPGYPGPATSFNAGSVALNTSGAWSAGATRAQLQDDWDWVPLPQVKGKKPVTMGQASPVILGASSKAKEASWELMKYLAGPVGQEVALERGISQPMLKAHHDSPAFTKHRPPHSPQVVVAEAQHAVPPPYGPSYLEVQALVDKVLAPVYSGQESARQAITAALPEIRRVLEESKQRFG